MLVLSRKLGEEIQIGDDIRITVVKLDRHGVRIGIEAPTHIRVDRSELRTTCRTSTIRRRAVEKTRRAA